MISIVIATYGDPSWEQLAYARALPSAEHEDVEVLIGHDPEGTVASTRNELGRRATGEWLCFLDADDELAPGYVAAMTEKMQPNCLLTPKVQQIVNGRERSAMFFRERDLLEANWLVVGTLLERELFMRVGGFGDYPHGFEDWSLWFKCVKAGARVAKVPNAVYRQHMNMHSKKQQLWRDRPKQALLHEQVKSELETWEPA